MLTAIAVWRQHPTAIEAELADRGLDIADWHRGRMSSRRLLALLRHPRRDGPYETALLEGEWPLWVRMLQQTHKEIALYRASKYVATEHEYEPQVFVSPPEQLALAEQERAEFEFQESAFDEMTSSVFDDDEGWCG